MSDKNSESFEEYFKKTWLTSAPLEEFDTTIERDIWNHQQKKLQAAEEENRILREAVEFYAYPKHEDGDRAYIYGHEARQALEKAASNKAGGKDGAR